MYLFVYLFAYLFVYSYLHLIRGHSVYEVFKQFISLRFSGGSVSTGPSGVSVLRTFRLLRILKLVRFMPALRRQLLVMLKTIDNVATFFSLLILFIFIFRYIICCCAFKTKAIEIDYGLVFYLQVFWA